MAADLPVKAASVSVIIPAFKAAGTIRRAVASVLEQTKPPLELLVVDDGSPDWEQAEAELRTLKALKTRSITLRKPNGGVASARNLGIDHAVGDWIAFLDADDYWEPVKLERQLRTAEASPDVAVLGSLWWVAYPGRPRERAIIPPA